MAARRNHVFREPSVDLTPDDASSLAEVGTPCLALRTRPAPQYGVHNDPRSRHVAADLVAHDHRIRRGHAARENLEVCPAYPAVRDTHEHLVGAWVRRGDIGENEIARVPEDGGLHRFRSYPID